MLDTALQNQLRDYFKKIERPVVLRAYAGEHAKKSELLGMLNDVAALSDAISVEQAAAEIQTDAPRPSGPLRAAAPRRSAGPWRARPAC